MDQTQTILYVIFLIFAGTSILATVALFTRQSLLVVYIVLGALLGPWGLKLVKDSAMITEAGDIGIIFLLFLLGLNLHPQNLLHSLFKMSSITFLSSTVFFFIGFFICLIFGYPPADSVIIGMTMMFSSTIIGLKLLPTTVMQQQRTGDLMISILLLQDLMAIAVLLILQLLGNNAISLTQYTLTVSGLPVLIAVAYIFQRYILAYLFKRFDKIHEYVFILSIGWCLSMAELSHAFGLSESIGAFIAGISLASNPISLYVAVNLRPLRDFFLIIFFFTVGAGFNFALLPEVFLPAISLASIMLIIKPAVFKWLLLRSREKISIAREVGARLGQLSEFSLLIVFLALHLQLFTERTTFMVQAATIFTFIVSCYWVAIHYPNPLAASDNLRRD